MTQAPHTLAITFPSAFYWEMWISEVDTLDSTSPADHTHFADALTSATPLRGKFRLHLDSAQARYYVENIEYHTDRWGDLAGQELRFHSFIRTGRARAQVMKAWLAARGITFQRDHIGVDRAVGAPS